MALNDFTYRLKAEAGDSTPHDEKGVSGDITGGTISLVDHSGTAAWRFSGGHASVAIPSHLIDWQAVGGGVTYAIRLKVANWGTVDWCALLGFGADPLPGTEDAATGVDLQRTGPNIIRAITGIAYTPSTTIGTSIRTIVVKAITDYSAPYIALQIWFDTVGRVGTGPNVNSGNKDAPADLTIDQFNIAALNGAIFEIEDAVFWPEELSDADCAALADNGIRATLDTGAAALEGAATASVTAAGALTTSAAVKGVRLTTAQASMTGLRWAWFDATDPSAWTAPAVQGSGESTDGSGVLTIDLTGTSLAVGGWGYLVINKEGAVQEDDVVFAGRLQVETI